MAFDHLAFRARYRDAMSPHYSGLLHMLVVLGTGLVVMVWSLSHIDAANSSEWLLWPLTMLLVNLGEYITHRWLGHRKTRIGRLFYARHTGDHHSFFIASDMAFEALRDWRVVLFPAWLIYVFLLLLILPCVFLLQWLWSDNAGYIFAVAALMGYLFYETMHFSYHLPKGSVIERIPLVWRLQRLHQLHHERERMGDCNFNITLPVFDVLFGTLYWRAPTKQDDVAQ